MRVDSPRAAAYLRWRSAFRSGPRTRRRHHPARRAPPIAREPYSARRLSYAALLIAAGLAGVYVENIPNFEVLTLVVFCSGVLLGARDGALVGAIASLIFSLLNPYGPVHPLVTASQVTGYAVTGLSGAAFRSLGLPERPIPVRLAALALIAVLVTTFFDLITNLATGLVYGQMRTMLLAGIPFALWHIGTNVALFVTLGVPLTAVSARYAQRLSS